MKKIISISLVIIIFLSIVIPVSAAGEISSEDVTSFVDEFTEPVDDIIEPPDEVTVLPDVTTDNVSDDENSDTSFDVSINTDYDTGLNQGGFGSDSVNCTLDDSVTNLSHLYYADGKGIFLLDLIQLTQGAIASAVTGIKDCNRSLTTSSNFCTFNTNGYPLCVSPISFSGHGWVHLQAFHHYTIKIYFSMASGKEDTIDNTFLKSFDFKLNNTNVAYSNMATSIFNEGDTSEMLISFDTGYLPKAADYLFTYTAYPETTLYQNQFYFDIYLYSATSQSIKTDTSFLQDLYLSLSYISNQLSTIINNLGNSVSSTVYNYTDRLKTMSDYLSGIQTRLSRIASALEGTYAANWSNGDTTWLSDRLYQLITASSSPFTSKWIDETGQKLSRIAASLEGTWASNWNGSEGTVNSTYLSTKFNEIISAIHATATTINTSGNVTVVSDFTELMLPLNAIDGSLDKLLDGYTVDLTDYITIPDVSFTENVPAFYIFDFGTEQLAGSMHISYRCTTTHPNYTGTLTYLQGSFIFYDSDMKFIVRYNASQASKYYSYTWNVPKNYKYLAFVPLTDNTDSGRLFNTAISYNASLGPVGSGASIETYSANTVFTEIQFYARATPLLKTYSGVLVALDNISLGVDGINNYLSNLVVKPITDSQVIQLATTAKDDLSENIGLLKQYYEFIKFISPDNTDLTTITDVGTLFDGVPQIEEED